MNDEKLAVTLSVALRERLPLPDEADLHRPQQPSHSLPRFGKVIAAVASVMTVAVVGFALAVHDPTNTAQPGSADALTGVTWVGSEPTLTVVFTDHSARIFDGCSNTLRQLTIGDGGLDLREPIGKNSVCSGTPGGPPPAVAKFDRVLSSDHLSWQRTGGTLRLTNIDGDTVQLHISGSALTVSNRSWTLERFNDFNGYSHEADHTRARLTIDHGSVYANDMCRDINGSATVTDTTIAFADVHRADGACAGPTEQSVADVVDHVLSGTITYTIRGDELILYGRGIGLLVYTLST